MPRITRKTVTGFIPIKRDFSPQWKVEIISGGQTYNIKTNIHQIEWNVPATNSIGQCKIKLDNNNETYTNLFSGGEIIKIYYDNSDGTTEKWRGYVENIESQFGDSGYTMKINGIHVAGELLDITVTKSYTDTAISDILKDIIDTFTSGFTYTNVETKSTQVTVNFSNKPFWECVIDLCNLASFDCYVDQDKDFHFFEQNSKTCTLDAVVHDDNLLENEGLGYDIVEVKNKIIIYGEDAGGLPIVYTAEDSSSQSSYNVKEKVIRDSDITTLEEAKDRADAELAELKNANLKGSVKSLALVDVLPGDKLWISIPINDIVGQYRVVDIKHKIDWGYFTTECEVQKPRKGLPVFFKDRMERELAGESIDNQYNLKYSFNVGFTSDSGTHSSTEVAEDVLRLGSGKSSGTWTSDVHEASVEPSTCELKYSGQDMRASKFYVSVDNGTTWEEVSANTEYTILGTGKYVKIKIEMESSSGTPSPELSSVAVLYS